MSAYHVWLGWYHICMSMMHFDALSTTVLMVNLHQPAEAAHAHLVLTAFSACADRTAAEDNTPRLEQVACYSLAGRVESLAVLRTRVPGLQRDALLLTFRRAPRPSRPAEGPAHAGRLFPMACVPA